MNECGVGISAAAFGAGDTNHAELFENLPKPSVTLHGHQLFSYLISLKCMHNLCPPEIEICFYLLLLLLFICFNTTVQLWTILSICIYALTWGPWGNSSVLGVCVSIKAPMELKLVPAMPSKGTVQVQWMGSKNIHAATESFLNPTVISFPGKHS